jgi:hypothetical protein
MSILMSIISIYHVCLSIYPSISIYSTIDLDIDESTAEAGTPSYTGGDISAVECRWEMDYDY